MNTFSCVGLRKPFLLAMLLALASMSGCGKSDPAPFVVNQWPRQQVAYELEGYYEGLDKAQDEGDKAAIASFEESIKQAKARRSRFPALAQHRVNVLEALFGTPDDPYVLPVTGLDLDKIKLAAGPVSSDQLGTVHGLYRRHCVHCHGVSGDGAGPTAQFLNPYPRDFRYGTFKFQSTGLGEKPTDDDLRRTIKNGIANTAMPSFKSLLTDREISILVEYVKYLSLRGELEGLLIEKIETVEDDDAAADAAAAAAQAEAEANPGDARKASDARDAATAAEKEMLSFSALTRNRSEFNIQIIEELLTPLALDWNRASLRIVVPETYRSQERSDEEIRQSIAAGRELFDEKAACSSCHGPSAQGDGVKYHLNAKPGATDRFPVGDEFNKIINWELPEIILRPRDLRVGLIRGGRRPIDIYRRIRFGINGTPMVGVHRDTLSDEEVWQLVDYVLALPYELNNPTTDHQTENTRQVH